MLGCVQIEEIVTSGKLERLEKFKKDKKVSDPSMNLPHNSQELSESLLI